MRANDLLFGIAKLGPDRCLQRVELLDQCPAPEIDVFDLYRRREMRITQNRFHFSDTLSHPVEQFFR